MSSDLRAWVVSADMGYGHQRAVHPLRRFAEGGIITVGKTDATSASERRLWSRLLGIYEFFSRARSTPLIGKPLFNILDAFLRIPSYYPIRNLSESTFQVNLLASSIRQGLCAGMLQKIGTRHLPLVTSFYAPAIAADMNGYDPVFCIICDADLNRAWVARDPWESRISYFAPCGKAAQRLRAYGVPDERIFLTGFPLDHSLLGGLDIPVLKEDLGERLHYLDPHDRFWPLHKPSVEHFLGMEASTFKRNRTFTVSYSVGGAGAQKEIGARIAKSLRRKIAEGRVRLNFLAGTRPDVAEYFEEVKRAIAPGVEGLRIITASTVAEYFDRFNAVMRETDVLWTKPSELSFYCGLGIPIIMTPGIGSQEFFNQRWIREIHAGFKQENPDYADQWLFDLLHKGRLADAAWAGFLRARKLGLYRIAEVLSTGTMTRSPLPIR
jgi:hypothetical protein